MQCHICWKDYSGIPENVVKFVKSIKRLSGYSDRADFLPPSRTEFKNEWIITTTPPVFPHDVYRKLPYRYLYVEV
jgi:hypothetical protein